MSETAKCCDRPHPGSDEAVKKGCRCPRMDNSYGRGAYGLDGHSKNDRGEERGWWISEICGMHWMKEARSHD